MSFNSGPRGRMQFLMAGVAILAVSAPFASLAQEQPTQLKPIIVEGDKETATGPVDGYVARETTTGSKSDTPINEIPQSISVIGREELDDRGVTNKVDEALRYTPGVLAQPFGLDPDTDWVYIRGFDATQTGMFLDGLNLYSYGFGGFQIDPYFLERVEVLKGPSSVLYGASDPGGIVNMISKRPTGEKLLSTEVGINNFGNAYFGFDAADALKDGFSYRVTGKVAGGDQETDYSHDFRGAILPQVSWSADDTSKVTVWGYYSALDQVHTGNGFYPYEGTVKSASFGKIDPKSFYGNPDLDSGTYQQTMLGYEVEHELENGIKLTQNVRYGHLNKHETGPYLYGYYDVGTGFGYQQNPSGPVPTFTRIEFEGQTKVDTFSIDNRANGQFDTGPVNHDLTVGLDYKFYRLDSQQASGFSTVSVDNPDRTAVVGTLVPYLDQVLTQQQLGIYAQDQMRFGGGWIATLNGRYDVVKTESDAKIGYSYESDDQAVSGRAGLAYEFANGITPYVSAATFFNPIIGSSATAPIEPEDGYQFEAGVKYEPTFVDGVFTASVFQITKNNFTVTDPATFLQSQIGQVRSTGVELEAKVNLNDSWKLLASASYQNLEMTKHVDQTLVGNHPYLIPDLTAAMWLDYTLPENLVDGVSVGAGLRYQGKSWADYANTLRVPDALLADAGIRYQNNGLSVSLNVTNLFDKQYVAGCQGALTCGYGQGRTFLLKVGKAW
jgi:iron complex outermembrane receptor protein